MSKQFFRKATLLVIKPGLTGDIRALDTQDEVIDLSELHFQFKTENQDDEGPSNCSIRVFNLADSTVERLIKYNFSRVIVQAGYEDSFGIVFQGDIKQFRTGKVNATDTYLDILAADGDEAYTNAVSAVSIAGGTPGDQRISILVEAFKQYGVVLGIGIEEFGGTLPRGKVALGMTRAAFRKEIETLGATWSIQNGKINVIPLDGYLPNDVVEINSATGLIGRPEQTQEGIRARVLMNPKILVGGRVRINNALINQTIQQTPGPGPLAFNKWTGIQILATIREDGLYRVYVAEHEGDTRGQAWYTDLICLAVGGDGKVKTE